MVSGNAVIYQPLVSILVPIWNERANVPTLIASFQRLAYHPCELVLCAGGADGSFEEASRYAGERIIVIRQEAGEGKQRALARCFAASHGELLFLTDADARLTDAAFSSTLKPLFTGVYEAATGPRAPLPEQMALPIIAYQWALEVAGNAQFGQESAGMLGSNAALTRTVAERVGSFGWEARTGTDLSLALRLRQHGIRIRYVPDHPMPVALATTVRDYSRQRSRWLRNLLLIGRRYDDRQLQRQALVSMGLGLSFWLLLLPGPYFRKRSLLWCALLTYGVYRRSLYVKRSPEIVQRMLRWRLDLLLFYCLVDFFTWMRAGLEALFPQWRGRW
ncbi:MAG: glycosyltransferase family 2 protein [Chloroflexi bacterium]|nr:glycosyltransferase family 2 protein [Chloroflexota bacterium]